MKTMVGNIFEQDADCIAITTNLEINTKGAAIMGAGIALQAKKRWPGIEYILGEKIRAERNRVHMITSQYGKGKIPMIWHERFGGVPDADGTIVPWHIVSFPTKYSWKNMSNMFLISYSMGQVVGIADTMKWKRIVIPCPGCKNGGLSWLRTVQPVLSFLLRNDNRFTFISNDKLTFCR